MNSKQIQNIETNQQHIVTTYTTSTNTAQNIQNINHPFLDINNLQINKAIYETNKIVKNENASKIIQEIQQNEENSNFQELPPFSSKYLIKQNNLFNNTPYNPLALNLNINQNPKKGKSTTIKNEINEQKICHTNKIDRYSDKKFKSHNIRNSINENKLFNKNIFLIQIFKSQDKQRGRLTTFENILNSKSVLELNKINDENEKYLLLIKRISQQLKRKIRPPSQGFFYKIIKNEQYKLLIKRIAFQLKRKTRTPTHGYFYKYIRNQQYILLIKRIAFQLKKRTRLPTCKIIKIYEPYIKLIKRIARQLNFSTNSVIIKKKIINNGNDNMILNNTQINNINNLNYQTNILNNNQINQNINSINSINEIKKVPSKSSLIPSYDINSKVEKIEIEVEIPEINIQNNQNILTVQNIENNNINSNLPLNIEGNQNEFSAQNSMKVNLSDNKFSFEDSDKLVFLQEKKILIEETMHNETNNKNANYNARNLFDSNDSIKNKKEDDIFIHFYPSLSNNKKNVNINLSIFKKEGSNIKENQFKLSKEKNVQNRSYKKETNLLNRLNEDTNINDDKESDLNVSLSNIEVTKTNFINDFSKFLNKVQIQIINNFPVSLNEKNKHYFQQNKFWLSIMNYLFFQNNNISLYTIISLLDQYFLWCTDINLNKFFSIKELIKEYIESNLSRESISQFLFMNHLKSIDAIFEKYEICLKNETYDYKEIKINNINLQNNEKINCNCELCTNDNACIQKVIYINKSKMNVINNINMDFLGKKEMLPEYEPKLNDISNKEEIFYKGKSKSDKFLFSKSKTVYEGNTNLEYNIMNNQNITKNENIEELLDNENNDEKNKTYKNISNKKSKKKEREKSVDEKDKMEKEGKLKKEEEKKESVSDNKNKKRGKKIKKGKEEKIKTERSKSQKKKKDKNRNKIIEREEENDCEEKIEKEELININIAKRKKSKIPKKNNRKY